MGSHTLAKALCMKSQVAYDAVQRYIEHYSLYNTYKLGEEPSLGGFLLTRQLWLR
jgi:hypothetical protein